MTACGLSFSQSTQNCVDCFKVLFLKYLPYANEDCEGYVFTGVCLSTGGGVRGGRGHVWWQGACVVAEVASMVAGGGHAWWQGACMVAGGHAWWQGGHVWWQGGMHGGGVHGGGGCAWWGCAWHGGACVGYDEIRSMSRRYASYWNGFLLIYNNNILYISAKA